MRKILCMGMLVAGLAPLPASDTTTGDSDKLTRMLQHSTLSLLKEGNARFAEGKPLHPNQTPERRLELAAGQEPLATVLACSDSRDPVELIFDRGVGDLFVIRVAGNIAGVSELATMEYGVTHLGTPVVVVMGHSKCGAVTAVVSGAELHGHLHTLGALIQPAAAKARAETPGEDDPVPLAIKLNVWQQVESLLSRSSLIREHAAAGKTQIVGAVYDIATGRVQWLGQHPEMGQLVRMTTPAESKPAAHAPDGGSDHAGPPLAHGANNQGHH